MRRPVIRIADTDLEFRGFCIGTAYAGTRWTAEGVDRILGTYCELGGNAIDTARLYMPPNIGDSETCIGKWLKEGNHRQQVILMTKGGHPDIRSMKSPRMSREEMTSDLNSSLKALQTDVIDVYFYHRDDESQPVGQLLELMEDFRKQGKIRYYACSNWRTERMREADLYAEAHGFRGFIANQTLYNVGTLAAMPQQDVTATTADSTMLTYHRENPGNLLMAYSALANGAFSDKAFPGSIYHTPEGEKIFERVKELQTAYHATLSQVLYGYILTRTLPILPLFSSGSVLHIQELFAAAEIPFSPDDFNDLKVE